MSHIAEYTSKQIGHKSRYFLYPDKIRIEYSSLTRTNWQGEFPINQLQANPDRGQVRNSTVDSIISWILLLVILLSFGAFGFVPSLLEPIAENWARILLFAVPAVMLIAIMAIFLAPRIDYATFRFTSGQPAFTVKKVGPDKSRYENIVAQIAELIQRSVKRSE